MACWVFSVDKNFSSLLLYGDYCCSVQVQSVAIKKTHLVSIVVIFSDEACAQNLVIVVFLNDVQCCHFIAHAAVIV